MATLASNGIIDSLTKTATSFPQGFGFGAGYGAGVRFGYTDLYPQLREALARIPFFGTGFDSAIQSKAPKPEPLKLPKWW